MIFGTPCPASTPPITAHYTIVQACIYNIYTNGSGQIISGRVTDPTGAPVAGATVTAVRNGGGTYSATTDTNGIYALANIPAASSYTLTTTKSRQRFRHQPLLNRDVRL